MSLPRHPQQLDSTTKPARRSKRRNLVIALAVVTLMATIHLLRQAL
jgi:hypothetical protein